MSNSWLGVPFRWHGNTKYGCDCAGLIVGILYENDILSNEVLQKIKTISYGTNLSKIKREYIVECLLQFFHKTSQIEKADLLMIRTKNSPIHFVIYECNKLPEQAKIRHITQEVGYVFENDFDKDWQIIGMFRLL